MFRYGCWLLIIFIALGLSGCAKEPSVFGVSEKNWLAISEHQRQQAIERFYGQQFSREKPIAAIEPLTVREPEPRQKKKRFFGLLGSDIKNSSAKKSNRWFRWMSKKAETSDITVEKQQYDKPEETNNNKEDPGPLFGPMLDNPGVMSSDWIDLDLSTAQPTTPLELDWPQ